MIVLTKEDMKMALEVLKGRDATPTGTQIINMAELKASHPHMFPGDGMQMDYRVFEQEIRPFNYIYVRNDVNSISFTIQNGPIKEVGVNGCQVTEIIEVAKMIIEGFDASYPCRENLHTIMHLREALGWQKKRTDDREKRGVEGESKE